MSMAFNMFLALVLLCLEMWLSLGLRLVVVVVVVLRVGVYMKTTISDIGYLSEAHTVFHLVVLTISWQFQKCDVFVLLSPFISQNTSIKDTFSSSLMG